jgi:hypothetical protein
MTKINAANAYSAPATPSTRPPVRQAVGDAVGRTGGRIGQTTSKVEKSSFVIIGFNFLTFGACNYHWKEHYIH